jgi:hypothetical protein
MQYVWSGLRPPPPAYFGLTVYLRAVCVARSSRAAVNGHADLIVSALTLPRGRQVPALIAVFELASTAVAVQRHTELVRPDRHPEFP